MKKITLISLLVSAVFPAFAQVSPAQTATPATLKEVAQRAVLNSPEVTAKWHAYRAA
ncbi:MAG: outer membrane protein LapE, partial [Rhodocyclaceae bacterium]